MTPPAGLTCQEFRIYQAEFCDCPAMIDCLKSDIEGVRLWAWEKAFEHYHDRLRSDVKQSMQKQRNNGQLHKTLNTEAFLDDVLMNTWVCAIEKISGFEWVAEDGFYHWLRSMSIYKIHEQRRREYHSNEIPLDLDEPIDPEELKKIEALEGHVFRDIEEQISQREFRWVLLRVIRESVPKVRNQRIIIRHYYRGLSINDIADYFNMSPTAVKQVLYRARNHIKAYIENHWADDLMMEIRDTKNQADVEPSNPLDGLSDENATVAPQSSHNSDVEEQPSDSLESLQEENGTTKPQGPDSPDTLDDPEMEV